MMAGNSPSVGYNGHNLIELFNEWEIAENIIQNFTRNGITVSILKSLTDDDLKEMCPHMATRILIRTKIQENIQAEDIEDVNNAENNDEHSVDEAVMSDISNIMNPIPDFNLDTILENAPEGNAIKDDYNEHGKLSEKSQNDLCEIIVRQLFSWLKMNERLKRHHYAVLITKITKLFPNICTGVFYTPPVLSRSSGTRKCIPVRGKLPDKIRNVLYLSKTSQKRKSGEIITHIEKKKKLQQLRDLHEESLNWLSRNRSPWIDVIEKWKDTFEIRQNSEYSTVDDFLKDWTIFNDPRSTALVCIDFETLFPQKGNNFLLNWTNFFENMKVLRCDKYNKDQEIKRLKEILNHLGEENVDSKLVIELMILSQLVPSKGRKNRQDKFCIQGTIDNMFIFAKTAGEIEAKIQERRDIAYEQKETVQPYIIIQGSIENCRQFLLVIDKVRYEFESMASAFDCLIKIYHVFHAKYPGISCHLYLLLQRCVYRIKTKYDVLPQTIIELVAAFEKTF